MSATAGPANRSTLNALTANLDIGDVADPALRLAFFQYLADLIDANFAYTAGLVNTDKFSQLGIINIKDYGAKGDGVTDDTAAMQSAIDALGASGGVVLVPNASSYYKITSTLTINQSMITIMFMDGAKIYISGGVTAIDINGDYCNIIGGEIYSGGTAVGNGIYGINVDGNYCVIDGTYVHDITYTAVFNNGKNNNFQNIIARNVGWDCGSNYISSRNSKWYNCLAFLCRRHGFSTDVGSQRIEFINCYAEDVGHPALVQGHDPYHFESSDYGKVINCTAKWTANSPFLTGTGGGTRLGVRVDDSRDIIIDGLTVIVDTGFIPQNISENWAWLYVNHAADNSYNTTVINSRIINNSTAFVSKLELGTYANVYIKKTKFYGYISSAQDSSAGFLREFSDCEVDGVDSTNDFITLVYKMEKLILTGNIFRNVKYAIKGGFMYDCTIHNNTFKNCYSAMSLGNQSGDATKISKQNSIRYNVFDGLTRAIESISATKTEANWVEFNTFKGTITNIFYAGLGTGFVYWRKNFKDSSLSYTNLVVTSTALTLYSTLQSLYELLQDIHDFSSAMPTSGSYVSGQYVKKSSRAIVGTAGSQYIVDGWERLTTGSNHVLNTDWVERRYLTGT